MDVRRERDREIETAAAPLGVAITHLPPHV